MRIKKTSQYIEGGAGLPSYFTTETNTGMKWIDGKPIYRKVIQFTTTSTAYGASIQALGISNVDKIFIDHSHSYIIGNDNCIYMWNSTRTASDTAINFAGNSWIRINPNKTDAFYIVGSQLTSCSAILTIEYTKTTD